MNYSPSKSTEAVVQYLMELDRDGVVGFEAIKSAVADRSLRNDVREKAMTFLQLLGDKSVCPALLPVIMDVRESYSLRMGAANTLGVLGCQEEINKALDLFESSSEECTRVLLTRSFWWGYTYGVPEERLIDTMFACVQNPEEPQTVRAEAAVALGNMLPAGRRANQIFAGLVTTLAASLSSGTADLKYQLTYAIVEVATGVQSESQEVQSILPSLADSLEQLFDDPSEIDGEILGEYACDVFGRLTYMGLIQAQEIPVLDWLQPKPALA